MLHLHSTLRGVYKLCARKLDGSIARETPWQSNLVTRTGLNMWMEDTAIGVCIVGAGDTEPTFEDTQLVGAAIATSNVVAAHTVIGANVPESYRFHRRLFRYPLGAVVGDVSELGLTNTTTVASMRLFSRALLTNDQGDVIKFNVRADEFLEVIYEVRVYYVPGDTVSNVLVNGVNTEIIRRPANMANSFTFMNAGRVASSLVAYSGGLGSVTGVPTAPVGSAVNVTLNPYTQNTFQRTGKVNIGQGAWNSNLKSFMLGGANANSWGAYQFELATAIPKTSTFVLSLDVTLTVAA